MSLFNAFADACRPKKKFTVIYLKRNGVYQGPQYEVKLDRDNLSEALEIVGLGKILTITKNRREVFLQN